MTFKHDVVKSLFTVLLQIKQFLVSPCATSFMVRSSSRHLSRIIHVVHRDSFSVMNHEHGQVHYGRTNDAKYLHIWCIRRQLTVLIQVEALTNLGAP